MLADRIGLVTGAGQGIGRAIAVEMARQGARGVAVLDIDAEGGQATAALVREAGADGVFVPCDLRDGAQITAAVQAVAERFGGLDVLVNNAGVIESMMTGHCAFDELTEEIWDAVYEINLKAVWRMTKAAAPLLRSSPRTPAVLNAGSTAGLVGYAHPVYCASKGGVIQLTKAMAIDLRDQIEQIGASERIAARENQLRPWLTKFPNLAQERNSLTEAELKWIRGRHCFGAAVAASQRARSGGFPVNVDRRPSVISRRVAGGGTVNGER